MKTLPSVKLYIAITSFSVVTIVAAGILVSQNYRTYRSNTRISYDTNRGSYISDQSLLSKKIREILLNPVAAEKFASTFRNLLLKNGGKELVSEVNQNLGVKKQDDLDEFSMLFLRFFDRNFDINFTIQSPFLEAHFEDSMAIITSRLKQREFAGPLIQSLVESYNELVDIQHTARSKAHTNLSKAAAEGAAERLSNTVDSFLQENKEEMKALHTAQRDFATLVLKISSSKSLTERPHLALTTRVNKLSSEVDNGPEILRRNYIDFMDTIQELKNSLLLYSTGTADDNLAALNKIEDDYYRAFVKIEPSLMQLELTTNGFREELSSLSTQQIASKQLLPYLDVASLQLPDPNADFLFEVNPSKKVVLIVSLLSGLFLGLLLSLSLRQFAFRKLAIQSKIESAD